MTALQIIGLILFIISIAGVLGYLFQSGKHTNDQQPYIKPTYTKEELDNIKLVEELYNKDLRPVVVQATPSIANDIEPVKPQAAAKKPKAKPVVDIEVVDPQFVEKVVETSKVLPPHATINVEAVKQVKESKSEFPIDKPAKKKTKYHRKTKK